MDNKKELEKLEAKKQSAELLKKEIFRYKKSGNREHWV